ncbi:MAG: hypothetical protein R3F19_11340 [Verrucomicrobiales bacterium]
MPVPEVATSRLLMQCQQSTAARKIYTDEEGPDDIEPDCRVQQDDATYLME